MNEKDDKLPPDVSPPAGKTKVRRRAADHGQPDKVDAAVLGKVAHDDLGNAVWNWRVEVPRRRDDDPTLDLLQCLDVDGLTLEDDDGPKPDEKSFNPYNKKR